MTDLATICKCKSVFVNLQNLWHIKYLFASGYNTIFLIVFPKHVHNRAPHSYEQSSIVWGIKMAILAPPTEHVPKKNRKVEFLW